MSSDSSWYGILLDAAQSRGIDTDELLLDQLKIGDDSAVNSWVRENLVHQKPLTLEEFSLWQHVDKAQKQLEDVDNVVTVTAPPADEEALQDLIDDLHSSTRALQIRSRAIQSQMQLATGLGDSDDGVSPNNNIVEARMERQHEAEKQHVLFMNHESETDVQEQLQLNQEKLDKCARAVNHEVREKCRADDRILDSLGQVASHVSRDPVAGSSTQPLLAALRQALALSLKTYLDRVYLTELRAHRPHISSSVSRDEGEQTRNDLQTLYAEIEDITSIMVETAHGKELKLVAHELEVLARKDAVQHAKQVVEQLEALAQSADQLSTRYRLLLAHRATCKDIDEIHAQVQAHNEDNTRRPPNEDRPSEYLSPEVSALLRHLNIEHDATVHHKDVSTQVQKMSATLADGGQRLVERILENTHRSIEESQRHLNSLLDLSNDNLFHAIQHNKYFDTQVAVTKSMVEELYKLPKTDINTLRGLIGGSSLG